jgi:quercetin dioxygenase-like cupin family protein
MKGNNGTAGSARRRLLLGSAFFLVSPSLTRAQGSLPLLTLCGPGERRPEFGCSILASVSVPRFPDVPVFWHLDAYPSRASAEIHRTEASAVVEAHDQIWLLTVAPKDWRAGGRQRVATVGPLPVPPARGYGLLFLEGVFPPGVTIFTHKHPGPEAWYLLDGEQCVETPSGVFRSRAGEGMVLPGDVPMSLHVTGRSRRRVLTLILHGLDQRPTQPVQDWKPAGLCHR